MLTVNGLTRKYGDHHAADNLTFAVRPGRLTGFVGANGAGKTTTMRMLMGILAPTAGEVWWHGRPITTTDRRSFGYMPEERGLYPRMKVREQLVFLCRLHGTHPDEATRRADELTEHFGLTGRRDDLLEELSLGNQQRVQIAAALIHQPKALILDEPFSGLDPLAVDSMVELLDAHTGPDVPILFSSHQLDLVERLCDDLIVLAQGKVVAQGTIADLRNTGPEQYRVVASDLDAITTMSGVSVVRADETVGSAIVTFAGTAEELVQASAAAGGIQEVSRHVEPLASVFREVVQ